MLLAWKAVAFEAPIKALRLKTIYFSGSRNVVFHGGGLPRHRFAFPRNDSVAEQF
jgi:hypothetical protein